ncbi:type I pantothenate kinase [Iodidimonas sp. SYSU 1G8]|uniref:type I pantothenate kinase n=1 Tax=Iodidimonas sp. SYSU 1G8 TaxID=3133967 RepID=UPI0031FE9EBA
MIRKTHIAISPYREFSRSEWSRLREDTPLNLSDAELDTLKGLNEPVSMSEVVEIYLPLSRLINLHYAASQQLFRATNEFLGLQKRKVPYIIGMAGSVSVGKSTTARILRTLLSRWADHPRVDLVPTDGFLLPNEEMERRGIMNRKGFPESYDLPAMLAFMADVKGGKHNVTAPTYSHLVYNVQPDKVLTIDRPDILIVEGLNVLQTSPASADPMPYVSDFFDFSIYIDASEEDLHKWYVERFLRLRETAFRDPQSYFHRYAVLSDGEARETATSIWEAINLVNLRTNILPTRQRADLILRKGHDHATEAVSLRGA